MRGREGSDIGDREGSVRRVTGDFHGLVEGGHKQSAVSLGWRQKSGPTRCTSPLAALRVCLLVRGSVWSLFWGSSQPDIIISLTQGRVISLPAPALLSWINIICDSQPLSTTEQPYLSSRQKPLAHFSTGSALFDRTALK